MLTSGIATGAGLSLIPFLLSANIKGSDEKAVSRWLSSGLALAIAVSILLRTSFSGLDYSLFPEGGWAGWGMGAILGFGMNAFEWKADPAERARKGSPTSSLLGFLLIIGLAWFAFSAPAVISRWTAGSYTLIVFSISLLAAGWVIIDHFYPDWIKEITPSLLMVWNIAFTLMLVLLLLAHRVDFPAGPGSPPVVVGSPSAIQTVPLILTLVLFPVIFLDLKILANRIEQIQPTVHNLIPGMLLGGLALVLLVFIQIFSNVWGYVEPVSPWFRNKFWLPYLLMAGLMTVLIGWKSNPFKEDKTKEPNAIPRELFIILLVIFGGTVWSGYATTRVGTFEEREGSLLVMTYNIQQANDIFGERAYREQLALIEDVGPDILALQESDSTRISLNNNDFVRFFASNLGYYSYFGPTTTTGTYGTAILSRYPLQKPETVFSYSDQDEVGTAVAEIVVNGDMITIYNVHPAGSDEVKLAFATALLDHAKTKKRAILLGDYNLRDYEEAYQMIDSQYINAWTSVYPGKIGSDGTDMSGDNRIDHIFFSAAMEAHQPVYILPPASATDHPAHWAEIRW
jgi:endonuclease/exonuclease/phosphatase family metal-dependent hydrolase